MNDTDTKLNILRQEFDRHTHSTIDGTDKVKLGSFTSVSLPDTQSQTTTNYGLFFVATRPCFVKAISEVHTVAGTNGSAVTLQVERLTGTTALGSGTVLLSTAFNLKGTANTVQRGILIPTPTGLLQGDRLALKVSGTLTDLKGVCVTVELQYTI